MVTASLSRSSVRTTGPRSKRQKQSSSAGLRLGIDGTGSEPLPGLGGQEERASKLAEELEDLGGNTGKQTKKAELW